MKYGCKMTSADAIKQLECIKYGLDRHAPEGSLVKLQDDTLRESALDFSINILKENLENRWRKCDTDPPKNDGWYLITVWMDVPDGEGWWVDFGEYSVAENRWKTPDDELYAPFYATAWKPRPKPYGCNKSAIS